MKTEAKLFALKYKDLIKGFVVAILTVVMTGAMTSLQTGAFPTIAELKVLAITGIGAGVAYLTKNFFTSSEGKMFTAEPKTEQPK